MWAMEAPAVKVAERLTDEAHTLPPEVLRLDDQTAAIVVEVDGVDYILTITRVLAPSSPEPDNVASFFDQFVGGSGWTPTMT